ncbi:MAG: glycosyltransferase family 1 protein [Rhodoferax sp.]|nr:glycosyltransferase family 1 protein [Rhodoferax sp.]
MDDVFFYLPESDDSLANFPQSVMQYWNWQAQAAGLFPYWGRYHWVLQTWLYLRDTGVPVQMVNRLPEEGIIITHMDCVEYGFRPNSSQTLIVMLVDREVPHPHAHLHITHNPVQHLPFGMPYRYMPPWPQIGLLPRDGALGARFEVIGFFGYAQNLDPAISDEQFQARMRALGLRLEVPPPTAWHDFRQVDAILAVRNFGRNNAHLSKPSLKLFNAWLAGVPAILGHESAYRAEGRPGTGYVEATTAAELLDCLEYLRDRPEFRTRVVEFGRTEVRRFAPERTVQRWQALLQDSIIPMHRQPTRSHLDRLKRRLSCSLLERALWRLPGRFSARDLPI